MTYRYIHPAKAVLGALALWAKATPQHRRYRFAMLVRVTREALFGMEE